MLLQRPCPSGRDGSELAGAFAGAAGRPLALSNRDVLSSSEFLAKGNWQQKT